ncbi:collagen alpha-1(VIII) chain-like [Mytilus californianus]|uniref:collagen alpha-1(VIII) chain-like n=1 Tax=Mytilus californianus TaxID=6549 RepID=UPI002246BDEC|nr:collagen alpha-1(VIII) chain-like [Mytilus californianus]
MITCPTIVIFMVMSFPLIACSSQSCVLDILDEFNQMKVDMAKSKAACATGKPAFFAALTPHFTLTGINAVLKFDDVRVNRGGAYDPSTGVFTATVQGLYHFSCMILANHGVVVHYQLNKNDQPYILGYSHKGAAADSSTISAIIELKVGDRVFVKHRHTAASEVVFGGAHTSFSGYFIHE